jgi:membrane-associated protease RseP (regulator of RpoE activity)
VYMNIQTPPLFNIIHGIIDPGYPVDRMNPIAFAGWVGLFLTMLNMIPVGQLDGGHVIRALLGTRADKLSHVLPIIILGFGVYATFLLSMPGDIWIMWGILTAMMGSNPHPKPVDDVRPVGIRRTVLAILFFGIVLLCFTPFPLS